MRQVQPGASPLVAACHSSVTTLATDLQSRCTGRSWCYTARPQQAAQRWWCLMQVALQSKPYQINGAPAGHTPALLHAPPALLQAQLEQQDGRILATCQSPTNDPSPLIWRIEAQQAPSLAVYLDKSATRPTQAAMRQIPGNRQSICWRAAVRSHGSQGSIKTPASSKGMGLVRFAIYS